MKYWLGLLVILSTVLLGILIGITTTQNNDIEDLQAQIEVIEEQIEVLEEQIEHQQDYIKEVHKYINSYTYKDGGQVFVYIDEDENYFD